MTEAEKTMLIDQLCQVSMDIGNIANILAGAKPIDLPSEKRGSQYAWLLRTCPVGKRTTTPATTREAKASKPEGAPKNGLLPDAAGPPTASTSQATFIWETEPSDSLPAKSPEPEANAGQPAEARETEASAGQAGNAPAPEPEPAPTCTYEEARAVMAKKARDGFRAEVKGLLSAHGVKQLSDITDPAELARLKMEVEMI